MIGKGSSNHITVTCVIVLRGHSVTVLPLGSAPDDTCLAIGF